jgi:hypothetical protein
MGWQPSHWRTHIFQECFLTTNQIKYGHAQHVFNHQPERIFASKYGFNYRLWGSNMVIWHDMMEI